MKSKLIGISISLLFPLMSYATADFPTKCPDAKAIQATLQNFSYKQWEEGMPVWYAYQKNTFDTRYVWNLIIDNIRANTEDTARKQLSRSIHTLFHTGGPDYGDDNSVECRYKAKHLHATARTGSSISILHNN